MEEVLECQNSFNSLLKKMQEDQKNHMSMLQSMVEQNVAIHCGNCYYQEYSNFDYKNSPNAKGLVEWLSKVGIDEYSIKKVYIMKFFGF